MFKKIKEIIRYSLNEEFKIPLVKKEVKKKEDCKVEIDCTNARTLINDITGFLKNTENQNNELYEIIKVIESINLNNLITSIDKLSPKNKKAVKNINQQIDFINQYIHKIYLVFQSITVMKCTVKCTKDDLKILETLKTCINNFIQAYELAYIKDFSLLKLTDDSIVEIYKNYVDTDNIDKIDKYIKKENIEDFKISYKKYIEVYHTVDIENISLYDPPLDINFTNLKSAKHVKRVPIDITEEEKTIEGQIKTYNRQIAEKIAKKKLPMQKKEPKVTKVPKENLESKIFNARKNLKELQDKRLHVNEYLNAKITEIDKPTYKGPYVTYYVSDVKSTVREKKDKIKLNMTIIHEHILKLISFHHNPSTKLEQKNIKDEILKNDTIPKIMNPEIMIINNHRDGYGEIRDKRYLMIQFIYNLITYVKIFNNYLNLHKNIFKIQFDLYIFKDDNIEVLNIYDGKKLIKVEKKYITSYNILNKKFSIYSLYKDSNKKITKFDFADFCILNNSSKYPKKCKTKEPNCKTKSSETSICNELIKPNNTPVVIHTKATTPVVIHTTPVKNTKNKDV
jgi:hypothetical protein